ncbi:mRNA-degrading endonuclease RelE of RelBE toxin-antitoxin system [Halopolyspora algeriensis]|uniref:mRNA-degrading endonuclease RelE of RelBE toxin-antitoxin system n=1 Tax=Halopolyspora algeriensis TaxID=1500506 RepID=A0A368VPJ6_9ACTN|nr:type II toxin-antitoxin system RelE/ParE family toxin [Halopolyspora algeriensis]RCW43649.1 mRNA-degrading endonuclease RelE of RelBE toxin-antitoxin system [Halopolyspora algeriensis]TQM47568.1 mRNA-degrading endonuclease RelE of RelBE toxin-antitoxin system [Halopolyspora algeriensis]
MSEPYAVKWSKPAKRAVAKELPEAVAAAVIELVTGALAQQPYRVGKPLKEPFEGMWSARRATYRVLYRVDDQQRIVVIESVQHRGHAYRP